MLRKQKEKMKMAVKIGVFLNGRVMIEYPVENECFMEAINDLKEATEETGLFHELKMFEDDE